MDLGDLNSQHHMGSMPTIDTTGIFRAVERQNKERCSNIDEEVVASKFEYSVDKFFEVSEVISSLYGEQPLSIDSNEIQHSSSTITFLEDWKHFYHDPKIVNFTYEAESPGQSKCETKVIHLPQFSSVNVPKTGCLQVCFSDDFLLHAGGSIWALDWCPGVSKRPDSQKNFEYLAVSAHPPGSSYHQMGIPLTGRGIIQIWCILSAKEEEKSQLDYNHVLNSSSRQRKRHSREKHFELDIFGNIDEKTLPAKPTGRPRKQPMVIEYLSNSDDEYLPPKRKRPRGRPRKQLDDECQSYEPKPKGGRPRKKLDGEYMSSQPKRPRERSRKQPESITRGKPRKQPESIEFANVLFENDKPICQLACGFDQDENLRDAKANGVSLLRSKMNGNDEIESSVGLTIQGKSCPKLGRESHEKMVGPLKFLDGKRWSSIENLSTTMSHISFNRLLGENPLLFSDDASSELVRECHDPTVMKYNLDQELTPEDCKESNLQNVNPKNSVIRCIQKQKIKDMARKITSIGDAPIFSKIEDGKQLCVHDNLSLVQSHGQASVSEVGHVRPLKMNYSDNHKNVTLPRVVLCLGHMGKVAWDIKWRPQCSNNLEEERHTLGYLAAVLGDGSLEVWEVPLLGKVKILYNSYGKKGTDPRFIRLKPVFRCSMLKCGDRKSIPLSVEWSPGSPTDLILAGCHDGTVALWKFTAEDTSLDTRPLICFTADSVPIRAIAWAPDNR